MTRKSVNKRYFDWMYQLVCSDEEYTNGYSYYELFKYLHAVEFTYILPMDENRAVDGTDLRYRFGYLHNIDGDLIKEYLDDEPCSVLEMMIALSIRWEDRIMYNPEVGDRTAEWFWGMLRNLDIHEMSDEVFDVEYVESVIARFLNREYEPNGEGGLFTVNDRDEDLRDVEIWYQMNWCYGHIS